MNIVLKSSCIFDSIGSEPFAGYIEIEGNKIKEVVRGETDKYNDISAHPPTLKPKLASKRKFPSKQRFAPNLDLTTDPKLNLKKEPETQPRSRHTSSSISVIAQ